MDFKTIAKNTIPLCFLSEGRLLCYNRGQLLVMREGFVEKSIPVTVSNKERLLGRSRLASRLFRFGVRTSVCLDKRHVILNIGSRLQELDLDTCKLTEGWCCGEGIRPLVMTSVKDIKGFADGVYFGGYLHNPNKNPVSIYHRTGVDRWEVIYTFPQGTINHVHNIVADPYRQCLWVYTGDFDDAAAIWRVSDGFKKVERIVCGDQKWRGCVVFVLPEGLLYATDTPFSKNHIYLFQDNGSVEMVGDISGSCIYGCQWKDKFVFSSTVEPDGRDESILKLIFSKKRGAGIEDDYVRMYIGNLNEGFKEVYKERKDWLPFLFQFGVFKFPTGMNNTDTLYFQPVATNLSICAYTLDWGVMKGQ